VLGHDFPRNDLTYGITHGQLLCYRFGSQRHDDEPKEGLLDAKVRGGHGRWDPNKGEEGKEGVTKRVEVLLAHDVRDRVD
jgi:hypothetical protein